MFDLLTPAKKIALLASAAVCYLMLTAFVASLTETVQNLQWASWLGYYSILGYAIMLVAGGLDLRYNKVDIARVGTCFFALVGTIGMVSGVPILTAVMFFLALAGAAVVVILEFVEQQKFNILYSIIAFAFMMLFVFWLILGVSRRPTMTVTLLAFDVPTITLSVAAGFNCWQILKGE